MIWVWLWQRPVGRICCTMGYVQSMVQNLWDTSWTNNSLTTCAVPAFKGRVHRCVGTGMGGVAEPPHMYQHGNAKGPEFQQHAQNSRFLCGIHSERSLAQLATAGLLAPVPHAVRGDGTTRQPAYASMPGTTTATGSHSLNQCLVQYPGSVDSGLQNPPSRSQRSSRPRQGR